MKTKKKKLSVQRARGGVRIRSSVRAGGDGYMHPVGGHVPIKQV